MRLRHAVLTRVAATVLFTISMLAVVPVSAADPLSTGETVYVSIYSHIYSGPRSLPYQLGALLSIRNTDMKFPITILKAEYYDSSGKVIENYLNEPMTLSPLASTEFRIKEKDERGGAGANFIVQWQAAQPVNQPIIEGLMLGLTSGQGISFICPGKILTGH